MPNVCPILDGPAYNVKRGSHKNVQILRKILEMSVVESQDGPRASTAYKNPVREVPAPCNPLNIRKIKVKTRAK